MAVPRGDEVGNNLSDYGMMRLLIKKKKEVYN